MLYTFVMALIVLGVLFKVLSIQKNFGNEWTCRIIEFEEPLRLNKSVVLLYISITWKPLRNENAWVLSQTY